MSVTSLPHFKYHPSPLSTGSIEDSNDVCECCLQARGFRYNGPMYCRSNVETVCPWCIADGSAHKKWNAAFTDLAAVGGYGKWVEVAQEIAEEVAYRTPGFTAYQDSRWWTHCGDAAEFVGINEDRVNFRCLICGKTASYRDLD